MNPNPTMKNSFLHIPLLALTAFLGIGANAHAADPTGTWQWTNKGHGGHTMTATLKLELKDGQLTGSVKTRNSETAIADASFKDDVVAFTVTREFHDQSFTIKYSGKLAGDTIKGTMTGPGRDGETVTHDWTATKGAADDDTAPPAEAP